MMGNGEGELLGTCCWLLVRHHEEGDTMTAVIRLVSIIIRSLENDSSVNRRIEEIKLYVQRH
ncbi:MAG: hypothetical protein JXB24_01485 [Bacteroidales bacterium]|nr:hypothetical protein [Bacteroidales bacterium]